MKQITDDTVNQIHRNLRKFGYSSLTLEETREAVEAAKKGETHGNIIAMFARTMLEENGYLETQP